MKNTIKKILTILNKLALYLSRVKVSLKGNSFYLFSIKAAGYEVFHKPYPKSDGWEAQ